jgi:hypothetical protein
MLRTATFLTKNFSLTEENVRVLADRLSEMSGFIAGGAALCAHLCEDAPADQDLDIWIPTMTQRNPEYDAREAKGGYHNTMRSTALGKAEDACYAYDAKIVEQMTELLVSFGYKDSHMAGKRYTAEQASRGGASAGAHDIPYHSNPDFQKIVKSIRDFTHPATGRKIQVIYFYGNADPIENFDLDICKLQLRPDAHHHELWSVIPEGTTGSSILAHEMRITNTSYPPNLARRIRKYVDRGFTLVTEDDVRLTKEQAYAVADSYLAKC